MQENEFERQLKQVMDGFNMTPPNTVWEKISDKIKDKRRRRFVFYFVLFLGLIIAGGSMYFFINNSLKKNTPIADQNINTLPQNSAIPETTKVSKNVKEVIKGNIARKEKKPMRLDYNINLYKKEKVSYKFPEFVEDEKLNKSKNGFLAVPKKNSEAENQNAGHNLNYFANKLLSQQNNIASEIVTAKPETLKKEAGKNEIKSKPVVADKNKEEANHSAKFLQENIEDKKQISSKNRSNSLPKLRLGFSVFYGKSNLLNQNKNNGSGAAAYMNFNPGTMGWNYDTGISKSNPFNYSTAFAFGFMMQKKIFKNAYLSTGLNFIQLSAKADIKKEIDAAYIVQPSNSINNFYSVTTYYPAGDVAHQGSRYSFLELPINFYQYFFQSRKVSVSYDAGFTARRLISSQSLIYNSNDNIYYPKDDLIRRTQFQLNGGINVEVKTMDNSIFFIGPQISYSLSNYLNKPFAGNSHFINYGIHAGLLFHKK